MCCGQTGSWWVHWLFLSFSFISNTKCVLCPACADIHTEAVQAALAKHKEEKMALPMPTKRRSTYVQSPIETRTPPGRTGKRVLLLCRNNYWHWAGKTPCWIFLLILNIWTKESDFYLHKLAWKAFTFIFVETYIVIIYPTLSDSQLMESSGSNMISDFNMFTVSFTN